MEKSSLTKILTVAAGVGVSASLLLFLFRKHKEGYEVNTIKTSRQTTIIVRVPQMYVGAVIGRGGEIIKHIQKTTNTKINFGDKIENDNRMVTIKGLAEDVTKAEKLILQIIGEQPVIEKYDMYVPQNACGAIIGRNGENIRLINRLSQAKVDLQRYSYQCEKEDLRCVTICGSLSQIQLAKNLIEEKVLEVELRKNSPRIPPYSDDGRPLLSITCPADETQPFTTTVSQVERLVPTSSDGFVEVFVSAVDSPQHFWVQVIGTRAKELDKLVEELTEYYLQQSKSQLQELEEIKVGDLVAAPFSHDQSWYRARILEIEEDSYSPQDKKVTVYYVDFGDCGNLTIQDVCKLEKRFLHLPFQAIECSLAFVRPKENEWLEEGIQLFEQLVFVAQWKSIMARPLDLPPLEMKDKPIHVELVDTSGSDDLNVADELVQQGFALWDKDADGNHKV